MILLNVANKIRLFYQIKKNFGKCLLKNDIFHYTHF